MFVRINALFDLPKHAPVLRINTRRGCSLQRPRGRLSDTTSKVQISWAKHKQTLSEWFFTAQSRKRACLSYVEKAHFPELFADCCVAGSMRSSCAELLVSPQGQQV